MPCENPRRPRCPRTTAQRLLAVTLIVWWAPLAKACDKLPQETVLQVRLVTPVSSYFSHPGNLISAMLTEDVKCDSQTALPAGTTVEGTIGYVRKVGWGIRHETAALRLDFTRLSIPNNPAFVMKSRVTEVYDARENVSNGMIHGIRSTDTPQGRINSRLKHLPTWNPYSDSVLIIFKLTFPIFPEPEIWYGRGTDLQVELTAPLTIPQLTRPREHTKQFTQAELVTLDDMAYKLPERAFTLDHKDSDITNIAFIASRKELESAFLAAGWTGSDKFSKSAFFKEFHAFLNNSSYAEAPMQSMLLGDAPPDLLWQKSLNTYSKRDHIRAWLWPEQFEGTHVWIGTTTHDVGATLSVRYKRFIHHIASDVDQERAKVIRDLTLAGCVDSVYLAPRLYFPSMLQNATGDSIRTDGAVAFVRLKDCGAGSTASNHSEFHPGNRPFRYARQQILTLRSDIWRANIIYGAFDLARMLHSAFRRPGQQSPETPLQQHSAPTRTAPVGTPFAAGEALCFH
jgi:LssY C-terminus